MGISLDNYFSVTQVLRFKNVVKFCVHINLIFSCMVTNAVYKIMLSFGACSYSLHKNICIITLKIHMYVCICIY